MAHNRDGGVVPVVACPENDVTLLSMESCSWKNKVRAISKQHTGAASPVLLCASVSHGCLLSPAGLLNENIIGPWRIDEGDSDSTNSSLGLHN